MPSMDDNRRRLQRRHLLYYLRVFDSDTGSLLGHIVDINTGGLMLLSEDPIETDKTFNLTMSWVDEHDQKKEVTFRAKSLWVKPDMNPDFWDTGFSLIDTGPSELQQIKEVISDLGFDSMGFSGNDEEATESF